MKIQDYTSQDITKFVTDSFDEVCRNILPGEAGMITESQQLITDIVSRAERVFNMGQARCDGTHCCHVKWHQEYQLGDDAIETSSRA